MHHLPSQTGKELQLLGGWDPGDRVDLEKAQHASCFADKPWENNSRVMKMESQAEYAMGSFLEGSLHGKH